MASGSSRAGAPTSETVWHASMDDASSVVTPLISRRRRRCSQQWQENAGGRRPALHSAQICQETGKEQEVQVLDDEGVAKRARQLLVQLIERRFCERGFRRDRIDRNHLIHELGGERPIAAVQCVQTEFVERLAP